MSVSPSTVSRAPAARTAPTQRTWWQAVRDHLERPAEWSAAGLVLLAFGVLLLAAAAIWVTRPGELLGGAAPLEYTMRYSDDAAGRYVYMLQEPIASKARLQATLQSIYNAHKAAAAGKTMTVRVLRRAADAEPFIVDGDGPVEDVVATATAGPGGHDASVRASDGSPLVPVKMRW